MDLAEAAQNTLSIENLSEYAQELINFERKRLQIYSEQLGIFFIERIEEDPAPS